MFLKYNKIHQYKHLYDEESSMLTISLTKNYCKTISLFPWFKKKEISRHYEGKSRSVVWFPLVSFGT